VKTPLILLIHQHLSKQQRLHWLCKVISTDRRVSKVDWQRVHEFQTVGPATAKTRRPNVLRRCTAMADVVVPSANDERRWRPETREWCAAVDQVLRSLMLSRSRRAVHSSGTSSKWRSQWHRRDKQWSNFIATVTRRLLYFRIACKIFCRRYTVSELWWHTCSGDDKKFYMRKYDKANFCRFYL